MTDEDADVTEHEKPVQLADRSAESLVTSTKHNNRLHTGKFLSKMELAFERDLPACSVLSTTEGHLQITPSKGDVDGTQTVRHRNDLVFQSRDGNSSSASSAGASR